VAPLRISGGGSAGKALMRVISSVSKASSLTVEKVIV
jgi:hypothetical protein